MTTRKVNMTELVTRANTMLATPDSSLHRIDDERSFRMGVCSLLEHLLHTTGDYRGFAYQDSELETPSTLRPNHDDSRRRYTCP